MNNKYYPRFAGRLRIFTMTSIIALFSLIVIPNSTGVTYAQTTSTQIQALLAQVNILKSAVQAQNAQISQFLATLRAGAGPSLTVETKLGPIVTVTPHDQIESTVDCPAGVATGGGQGVIDGSPSLQIVQSLPHIIQGNNGLPTPVGWEVTEFNPTNTNHDFSAVVVCATVTQGTIHR